MLLRLGQQRVTLARVALPDRVEHVALPQRDVELFEDSAGRVDVVA